LNPEPAAQGDGVCVNPDCPLNVGDDDDDPFGGCAFDEAAEGEGRARPHCRLVLPLIHFIPDPLR
jgi:hypothetical protein